MFRHLVVQSRALLKLIPHVSSPLVPGPQGRALLKLVPHVSSPLVPGPQGRALLKLVPHVSSPLVPGPQGRALLKLVPLVSSPLVPGPQGRALLKLVPHVSSPLVPSPQGRALLKLVPHVSSPLVSGPQGRALLKLVPHVSSPLVPGPQGRALLKLVPHVSSPLVSGPQGRALLKLVPHVSSPLVPGPQGGRVFLKRTLRKAYCTSASPLKPSPETITITDDGKQLEIQWIGGQISRFHASWLRHNCTCEQCYSPVLNQPLIQIDQLPLDSKMEKATLEGDVIRVQWHDEHQSGDFCPTFLKKYCYSGQSLRKKKDSLKTSLYKKSTHPNVQWEECENDDAHLYRWLRSINEHGLCLIKGAPLKSNFLTEFLPERVAPLTKTTYGTIYDVQFNEVPINLAYTRSKLQFHMDLVFYESTPGIQFLHCLRFDESIIGGETVFVDMFAVSEEFRQTNPVEFNTLSTVPCTFARVHTARDHPAYLVIRRPVINLNNEKEIISLYWNPGVVGPLEVSEDDVDAFYQAYQLFARAISNFHTKNIVRLRPGDVVGFNNRRMAHGRNAFSSGTGKRHFQGCYIDISAYKSCLIHLATQHGDVDSLVRVGDMDWL